MGEQAAEDAGAGGGQALDGGLGGLDAGVAGLHHHQGAAHQVGQDRRVGDAQHGRAVDDHLVVLLRGHREHGQHAAAGKQLGRVGRQRACQDHVQAFVVGLVDHLLDAGGAGQQAGQPGFGAHAHHPVQRGVAQVGLHQQHRLAQLGEVAGQGERGGGLAFRRAGTGDQQGARHAAVGGELQRGAHRAVALGERGARVGQGGLHGLLAQVRDDAQHGQAQVLLDVLGRFDGVVEELQHEGHQHAEHQAEHEADGQVERQVGLEAAAGHHAAVDDGDVVAAHAAGHADFLVALQQAVVELAVGVHLAAQDVVVDGAVVHVQRAGAQRGQLLDQHVLARLGGIVLGADGGAHGGALLFDLALDLVDLALQRDHGRVLGLVGLQLLLVLGVELGALLVERVEDGVGDGAGGQAAAAADLAPGGLGGDALVLGGGQGGVERPQVLLFQALAGVAGGDDVLAGGEFNQAALGLFQPALHQRQLFFQVAGGIRGCVELALDGRGDEAVGHGVDHPRGERRQGAVVMDADQARVAHRLHGQTAADDAGGRTEGGELVAGVVAFAVAVVIAVGPQRGGGALPPGVGAQALGGASVDLQLVGHPLGQRAALEQFVLGGEEVGRGAFGVVEAFHLHGLHRLAVDLQGGGGAVHRRHHQGDQQRQRDHAAEHAQHQPAALDQDAPVGEQVDLVVVAALLLEQVDRDRLRAGPGRQVSLLGAGGETVVPVVVVRGCRQVVVLHAWGVWPWGVGFEGREITARGTGPARAPTSGIRGTRTCCRSARSRRCRRRRSAGRRARRGGPW